MWAARIRCYTAAQPDRCHGPELSRGRLSSTSGIEEVRRRIRDTHLDRHRREIGDRHGPATRHLFNKLLGQLHHCLKHSQTFDETKAFPCQAVAAA